MPLARPSRPLTSLRLQPLARFGTPRSVSNFSDALRRRSDRHRRLRRSDLRLHHWDGHRRHRWAHAHHRSVHARRHRSSGRESRHNSERSATHRSWAIRDIRRTRLRHTKDYARSAVACPIADARTESTRIHGPCHSSSRHTRRYRAGPRNSVPYGSSSCRRQCCRRAPRTNWLRHARPGCSRAA
jgi:hypothetical protein